MSSKQWVVGYFQKENKYSVVPFIWILNKASLEQLCKWPMFGVVNSMIMEATYPELDWPTFPVKIVSQIFYTYEDAKMKESELFLAVSKSEVKKKRKSKNIYPAKNEAENFNEYSGTYPTPIKVLKTNHVVDHQKSGSSTYVEQPMNQTSDQLLNSNILSSSMNTVYDDVWINTDGFTEEVESPMFDSNIHLSNVSIENKEELKEANMMNYLCNSVTSILTYVQLLDGKLDSLIQNKNNALINKFVKDDFIKIFPFKYVESVDDMENKLKLDENTSDQLRKLLQKIGGKDLKNFVKRVFERLFTNELSAKYSWVGFRDNHKLKDLQIIKIMRDVANNTFLDTEINFETHVKNWFRHGPKRYAREQKKTPYNQTHRIQTHRIINVPELHIQCAALQ